MIVGGPTGCELMMISQSHWTKDKMEWAHLRKCFKIKILDGMDIIFTDQTYHAGAATNHEKKNGRFFCYIVKDKGKMGYGGTPHPSGDQVQTVFMKSCQELEDKDEDNRCTNKLCLRMHNGKNAYRTLNFTNFKLEDFKIGDILGGGIKEHGWVVVKGISKVGDDMKLNKCVEDCGKDLDLGNGTPIKLGGAASRRKLINYADIKKNIVNYEHMNYFQKFMKSTTSMIQSKVLGVESYVHKFPNILFNNGKVDIAQKYHRDYQEHDYAKLVKKRKY